MPVPNIFVPGTVIDANAVNANFAAVAGAPTTPEAGLADVIVNAGVAIIAATGPFNGGYVINPNPAAAQGLGLPENAYLDMTGAPGSTDATGFGTCKILFPGDEFTLPAVETGVNVWLNAASAGHRFTVVIYP